MASASSSRSSHRSSSPPPPTLPPREPPLRDPLEILEEPPRRNPTSPPRTFYEARSRKRRRVEDRQDKSLYHGFALQPHAAKILESNDLSSLQDAIKELAKSKSYSSKTILDSLALHYPNSFSFKLAKLLQLHPPLEIRTQTVALLRDILVDMRKLNSTVLLELKNPLLHSVKAESEESLLPPLCETIGSVAARLYEYSLGGWVEFLEYVCSCVSGEAKSSYTKGLMLLAELPVEAVESRKFWLQQGNFDALFASVLKLAEFPDQKLQALTFDASMTLMGISKDLGRTEVSDRILPILFQFIDLRHAEEEVVVHRVRRLTDLVTLDVGEIFDGKEGDVFRCMLRLVEAEGASEELRCVAIVVLQELDEVNMDVMQDLIRNLSPAEVKRVFAAAIGMMSCYEDDPLWYEVDKMKCQHAGMTESFSRGKFLLNWLAFDGDAAVVVPTVIEMITTTYAPHNDWRVRQAAMIALGTIAERGNEDMIPHFEQISTLVLKLLSDQNHRVLWATMHAIRCLSEYKEQLTHAQYHMKFLARVVPIVNYSLCARVQAYAVIAIRYLVTNCGLDKMASFREEIVTLMIVLLKHEKQKLQEEAIETLKSIAMSTPVTFRQYYYDTTMKSLKAILFEKYSLPKPKLLLRAKCLECMSSIVSKVEQNKFKEQEVVQVIESLISLEEKVSNKDYLTRSLILKALDQFRQCPGVEIVRFMNKIVPMLLGSAQLDIDLQDDLPTDDSLDDNKYLVETVRVRACNILSYCAARSPQIFSPHCGKVIKIFVRWLGCSSVETRKASILAAPNLLLSIKSGVQNEHSQRAFTTLVAQSLIEVLQKETNSDLSRSVLRLMPRCIQTSGLTFTSQLIKKIADEIKKIINKIVESEMERAQEAGTSERGSKHIPTEEIIQDANNLIAATIETFGIRFSIYVDDLMSNVAQFLGDDFPDTVIAFAISIFNIIVPRFPDRSQTYHNKYILTACQALRDENPHAQLHGTRAIGICAVHGGHRFKTIVSVAISRLYSVIMKGFPFTGQPGDATRMCADAAVAALGKICEFHRESIIDGPKVVGNWLNFLPLASDFNEARYAHGLLSKMIKRSDAHLFGPDNENLPKIIFVVREILSRPDRLAPEEAINQMIDFINQHGGMKQ